MSSKRKNEGRKKPSARQPLRVVGLFAGIGGIELGLGRAGHQCTLLCENDKGARAVLDARFAEIPKHGDVTSLKKLPRDTEMVAAGFPCQDLSQAGQTAGISGGRSGLVGEVFRLLERQPVPWLLLENVPFMLQLAKGRALEVIVNALERLGYKWAYRVVDSRAFGLPQRRERVFVVASLDGDPREILFADEAGGPEEDRSNGHNSNGARVACGFYWTEGTRGLGWAVNAVPTLKGGSTVGIPSPPAIWMPSGEIVRPDLRDTERLQGFRKDWTRPAERVGRPSLRWKLVGNAVTVNVARWIGSRFISPGKVLAEPIRPLPVGARWPRAAWNVGDGRQVVEASAWPFRRKQKPLHEFLREETPMLSAKATAGFLKRARNSSLRFQPGFLDAVAAHLERMTST